MFLWKVWLPVRELCSVGCEAREQESVPARCESRERRKLFLWKVRLSVRELCFVGCEARKQDSLFLQEVRVGSGGSCFL